MVAALHCAHPSGFKSLPTAREKRFLRRVNDPLSLMPSWAQDENWQGWTPALPDLPVQVSAGVAGETEEGE
jgi:hypothetical protein